MSETLKIEDRGDRMVVTLHRPDARNAINVLMITELRDVCAVLERDPKPLILTGHGGVFAGGADIAELRERGAEQALQGINRNLFDRIARLQQPTVAAVEGYALGGGAELAYACDLRIASPTALFGNPEPGLGILAAAGASYRLAELVGKSVARQVLLGGYQLDAQKALQHGLVAEVVEAPLARAHEVVDRMIAWSPGALRLTKLVLDAPGAHPLADDLAQAVLFETQDKRDRMARFLSRRTSR